MPDDTKKNPVIPPAKPADDKPKSDKKSDDKKPEPGTRENPKPGQQIPPEEDENAPKLTNDFHGKPLEPGSLVTVATTVTKAEDGKVDLEIVDPDPEAKPITLTGVPSGLTKDSGSNPRIAANPIKRGVGIREVLAKEGGIKPVAKTEEDDKSTDNLPPLTALKASTLTPVESKPEGTKKAA